MRGHYKITTLATALPVSLDYVKEHSKIDYTDEDTVLTGYLKAAIDEVEKYCNRALMAQTITQVVDSFPAATECNPYAELELFRSPVQSLTSIKYWNTDDTPADTTLFLSTGTAEQQAAAILHDTKEPATVSPKVGTSWPNTAARPGAVTIVYVCGYSDATFVPETIKQAICLLTASHYEKREDYAKRYKSAAENLMDLSLVQGW